MAASLQQIRRALTRALGSGYLGFSDAGLTTTGSGSTAEVISTNIAEGHLSATYFDGWYIYIVDGAQAMSQRRVNDGSFNSNTGTLTATRVWPVAVQSGVKFELHTGLCPPLPSAESGPGLHACINRALQRLWVLDRVPVAGVTNKTAYAIDRDTYPWLTEAWRIRELYDPPAITSEHLRPTQRRWRFRDDVQVCAVEFPDGAPYVTGDTFYLEVYRPANTVLRTPASDPTTTGSITAAQPVIGTPVAGATVVATMGAIWPGVTFGISGTYGAANVVIDYSTNGSSYTNISTIVVLWNNGFAEAAEVSSKDLVANGTYALYADVPSTATHVRLRATTYTSGTLSVQVQPGAISANPDDWDPFTEGWVNQTTIDAGLTAEAQEAAVDLADVVAVAQVYVYEALLARGPDDNAKRWENLYQMWTKRAGALEHARRPSRPQAQPPLEPMVPTTARPLQSRTRGGRA